MFQAVSRGVPSFGDLSYKAPCRAITVAALPANTRTGNVLTASANGALPTIDGYVPVVGDRIVVKDEATSVNNGIYTVTSLGSAGSPWVMTRSSDANTAALVGRGVTAFVTGGTILGGTTWVALLNWQLNVTPPGWVSSKLIAASSSTVILPAANTGGASILEIESEAAAVCALLLTRRGQANNSMQLDATPAIQMGDGTNPTDVYIERTAAQTLAIRNASGLSLSLLDLVGAPIRGKAPLVTVFAAGGTWTPGAGILYAIVEAQAGGGGGGGSSATAATTWSAGAGGGGGGYGRRLMAAATLGASQVVTVGAGGLAGAVGALGGTGGTSSFGALLSATGGAGGQGDAAARATASVSASGGTGGTSTLGDLATPGGDGEHGRGSATPDPRFGGYGAGSALAGQTLASTTGAGANGNTGKSYGGGGSGATTALAAGAAHTGGAGGPGVVIVTEYFGP